MRLASFTLLCAAPLSPANAVPADPAAAPAPPTPTTPAAQITHGANVMDRVGSPLGTVDSTDGRMVILVVGARRVQMPIDALSSIDGMLVAQTTASDLEALFKLSVAFQAKTQAEYQARRASHQVQAATARSPEKDGLRIESGRP